jgi:hypothetical protein
VFCGSEFIVPGRYTLVKPVSGSALNRLIKATISAANSAGYKLGDFSVHDIRRTGSTLLHEAGFPSDWIEKALAHEQKGVRAVYNGPVCGWSHLHAQWADMVDSWVAGEHTDLVPFSPAKFESGWKEISRHFIIHADWGFSRLLWRRKSDSLTSGNWRTVIYMAVRLNFVDYLFALLISF